jgi:hypothetical protein
MRPAHQADRRATRDQVVLDVLTDWRGNRKRAAAALGLRLDYFLAELKRMRARGVVVPTRTQEAQRATRPAVWQKTG